MYTMPISLKFSAMVSNTVSPEYYPAQGYAEGGILFSLHLKKPVQVQQKLLELSELLQPSVQELDIPAVDAVLATIYSI